MADSLDSGSSVHYGRAGSSPASRTNKKSLKALCFQGFFIFLDVVLALWLALFLRQTLDEPLHTVSTSLYGCQIDVRHVGPLMSQQPGHGEMGIQETVLNLYRDFRSHEGGTKKASHGMLRRLLEKILLYHTLENCHVFPTFPRHLSERFNE